MSRHPRNASNPRLHCNECNAPVVKTTDDKFVCVGCERTYPVRDPQQSESGQSIDTAGDVESSTATDVEQ